MKCPLLWGENSKDESGRQIAHRTAGDPLLQKEGPKPPIRMLSHCIISRQNRKTRDVDLNKSFPSGQRHWRGHDLCFRYIDHAGRPLCLMLSS